MPNHTDHQHSGPPPLVVAAHAVDERLPAAWIRVADYLETYKEPTGTLGKRKTDGDGGVAELRAEDLHVILGALEAILDAHTGPDEPAVGTLEFEENGVGLADLDAKLDQILKHVEPLPTRVKYDLDPGPKPLATGGIVVDVQPSSGTSDAALAAAYAAGRRAARRERGL